jgi:DNA-binding NarL/FixJ family response regulator
MSSRGNPLSETELDVLEQVARGLDNAAIARRGHWSVETVRTQITHVRTPLGPPSSSQASTGA